MVGASVFGIQGSDSSFGVQGWGSTVLSLKYSVHCILGHACGMWFGVFASCELEHCLPFFVPCTMVNWRWGVGAKARFPPQPLISASMLAKKSKRQAKSADTPRFASNHPSKP
eukprot:353301-Chlamydomonas_euryale.AAC.2